MLSTFRQRRVVGVRVGLPRHDMEVEGAVVKDDAVLELRVRCCTRNAPFNEVNQRNEKAKAQIFLKLLR